MRKVGFGWNQLRGSAGNVEVCREPWAGGCRGRAPSGSGTASGARRALLPFGSQRTERTETGDVSGKGKFGCVTPKCCFQRHAASHVSLVPAQTTETGSR